MTRWNSATVSIMECADTNQESQSGCLADEHFYRQVGQTELPRHGFSHASQERSLTMKPGTSPRILVTVASMLCGCALAFAEDAIKAPAQKTIGAAMTEI